MSTITVAAADIDTRLKPPHILEVVAPAIAALVEAVIAAEASSFTIVVQVEL